MTTCHDGSHIQNDYRIQYKKKHQVPDEKLLPLDELFTNVRTDIERVAVHLPVLNQQQQTTIQLMSSRQFYSVIFHTYYLHSAVCHTVFQLLMAVQHVLHVGLQLDLNTVRYLWQRQCRLCLKNLSEATTILWAAQSYLINWVHYEPS